MAGKEKPDKETEEKQFLKWEENEVEWYQLKLARRAEAKNGLDFMTTKCKQKS